MSMRAWERRTLSVVLVLLACAGAPAQSPVSALPGALPPSGPLPPPPPGPVGITDESPPDAANGESPAANGSGLGRGLYLDAEYLFLRPLIQPRNFAIIDPTSANVPQGSIAELTLPWRSALRVGIGYECGSGWGGGFHYTYLHSAAYDALAAPPGGVLFATLTHPGTVEQVQTAVASASLNYNVFDVDFGRSFHPCENVALRAFGGVRFARIEQGLNTTYDGIDANQDLAFNQQTFNGAGLMLGGEGNWTFWHGLGVFARATGSMLAGQVNAQVFEGNNAGSTVLTNVTDRFEKVVPVVDIALGASWQYRNLTLMTGYQFVNWFGLIDQPNFTDDFAQGHITRSTGDLSLNGWMARLAWNF